MNIASVKRRPARESTVDTPMRIRGKWPMTNSKSTSCCTESQLNWMHRSWKMLAKLSSLWIPDFESVHERYNACYSLKQWHVTVMYKRQKLSLSTIDIEVPIMNNFKKFEKENKLDFFLISFSHLWLEYQLRINTSKHEDITFWIRNVSQCDKNKPIGTKYATDIEHE
jgi:hypothetical protein